MKVYKRKADVTIYIDPTTGEVVNVELGAVKPIKLKDRTVEVLFNQTGMKHREVSAH
jgi:hypothetical protein